MLHKNTFSTERLQTTASNTASEFLQKNIDKCKERQTNESKKKDSFTEKKEKHGIGGNELKCQLL